jgi:transposase
MELAQGKVVGECYQRHRHQEFLKFLRRVDEEFPGAVPLHLVMDNYGSHGKLEVRTWLKKHPRFRLHFVPTSCSWLNLVERWFRELSTQCIRRDAFFSVADLQEAILEFLAVWNEDPKTFVWNRHRGFDHGKAVALPANLGENSARLYAASQQKKEAVGCIVI